MSRPGGVGGSVGIGVGVGHHPSTVSGDVPPPPRKKPFSFTGYWVLDAGRSMSPAVHLEGMGLPDMAQAAVAGVSPTYEISVPGDGTVAIRHMSEVGEKERFFRVGVEHVEAASKDGATIRMLLEMPSPHVMINHIEWSGRGKITDTRVLVDDGAGGVMIHQHVDFLHAKGGGKRTTSDRYFVRGNTG